MGLSLFKKNDDGKNADAKKAAESTDRDGKASSAKTDAKANAKNAKGADQSSAGDSGDDGKPKSRFGFSLGGKKNADGKPDAADQSASDKKSKADKKADKKAAKDKKDKASKSKVNRDQRKARRFFEHGQAMADSRQYDYALECYINGLNHAPDNMQAHESLREAALRRKVNGGKPAGFAEKLKLQTRARDRIEKMLNAEMLWAKNPLNPEVMFETMERAVDAHEHSEDFMLGEVAYWVGTMFLEKEQTERPLSKKDLLRLRELFTRIGRYDRAMEACQIALMKDPNDLELQNDLRDLETEVAMQKGGYEERAVKAQRDEEAQDIRLAEDAGSGKTEEQALMLLNNAKEEFEESPEDNDLRSKYIRRLRDVGGEDNETEAIRLLEEAQEQTGQYRHRLEIGDIRMRQNERKLRVLRDKVKADKSDEEARNAYAGLYREALQFDLKEFAERCKHYPTEMRWRFELGVRLMRAKAWDKAISSFQQARQDPKFVVPASNYLGLCYQKQEWFDEAIDTFREGVERSRNVDDSGTMELRYNLMDALTAKASKESLLEEAQEAQKIASSLLQYDINFRDIQKRAADLKTLVKKLQNKSKG